jgi:hypothetical protein
MKIFILIFLFPAIAFSQQVPFLYLEKLDPTEQATLNAEYLITEPDEIEIIDGEADLNIDGTIPVVEINEFGLEEP